MLKIGKRQYCPCGEPSAPIMPLEEAMARKLGLTPHRARALPLLVRPSTVARPPAGCPAASQSRSLPPVVVRPTTTTPSSPATLLRLHSRLSLPPALLSLPLPFSLGAFLTSRGLPAPLALSLLFHSSRSLHSIDRDRSSRPPLPLSVAVLGRLSGGSESGFPPSLLPPSDRQQSGARRRRGGAKKRT